MAINLQKGQTINLAKDKYDLSTVTIGLGWDVAEGETAYDLDLIAFLLNSEGKVAHTGDKLVGGDVIFYNSMRHPSGNIYLTGDDRDGSSSDGGDDEQIIADLDRLDQKYDKIVIVTAIYKGHENKQSFGRVENAFVRAVDARGNEMFRYDLSRDKAFEGKCAMVFGELYRRDGGWKFRAVGMPYDTDRFAEILRQKYL